VKKALLQKILVSPIHAAHAAIPPFLRMGYTQPMNVTSRLDCFRDSMRVNLAQTGPADSLFPNLIRLIRLIRLFFRGAALDIPTSCGFFIHPLHAIHLANSTVQVFLLNRRAFRKLRLL
jgi:hypothetical protein